MKSQQERDNRYPVWSPEAIVCAMQACVGDADELARARFLWAQRPEIKMVCGPVYCWLLALSFSISLIILGYNWLAVGSAALTLLGMWWWWTIDKHYARWKRDYFISLDRILRT